jgi:hypothetical protein
LPKPGGARALTHAGGPIRACGLALACGFACGLALLAAAGPARGAIDPDLILHLKLDEASGTTAADASGKGNPGTVVKGSGAATWVAGRRNGALRFAGLSATGSRYIDVPWNSSLVVTTGLTALAWVRLDQTPNQLQTIAGRGTGTTDWALYLFKNANHVNFDLRTANGNYSVSISTSGPLATGTWYHIAATYDGTRIRVYVNGTELGNQAASGQVQCNASGTIPLGVAARATAAGTRTDPLLGTLDEVKVWKRALAAAEILADMNGGGIKRLRWTEKF